MLKRLRRTRRRGFTLVDVIFSTFLMAYAVLLFTALYPAASRTSSMSAEYAQAISVIQHKVDQLRSVGYGRLNYTDLRAASIVDSTSTASPYRFEGVDSLSAQMTGPTGTIAISTLSGTTDVALVTVTLNWSSSGNRSRTSSHAVTVLIPNQ